MKQLTPSAALLALALLAQCKKSDPNPLSQLPPVTQTGANTFGCLVNGQVWKPNGKDNYLVDFDPNYQGGVLTLNALKYAENWKDFQSIHFGGNHIGTVGTYPLGVQYYSANFHDTARSLGCNDYDSGSNYCKGSLTVTRRDPAAGIVSGTFEFTLAKASCDTIRVTDGRFDKKM